jgi:hypothetical protein
MATTLLSLIVPIKVLRVEILIVMHSLFATLLLWAWNSLLRSPLQRTLGSMVCSPLFLLCVCPVCSLSLSAERVGALHVLCSNEQVVEPVLSQLKFIIRAAYSSPPLHGALIVQIVLSNPELLQEWFVLYSPSVADF